MIFKRFHYLSIYIINTDVFLENRFFSKLSKRHLL